MDPSRTGRLRRGLGAALRAVAGALLSLAALSAPAKAVYVSSDSLTVTIRLQDSWPPAPVADLSALAGAEGQLQLQWTAPDSNLDAFPTKTAVAGYQIRIATYSVSSIGGSTTTWWLNAQDTRSLPAPTPPNSGDPPAPAAPGTVQTLLLQGLEPGVTYFAMIISTDANGLVSDADTNSVPPGVQANALVTDVAPPGIAGVKAVLAGGAVTISWNAPPASTFDLDSYKIYLDSTAPRDFAAAYVLTVSSQLTSTVIAGLPPGDYGVTVTAVDKGQPTDRGWKLEGPSVSSDVFTITGAVVVPPQEPFGVAISSAGGGGVTLRWMPVTRFEDGSSFAVPAAPTPSELMSYVVYRSTGVILQSWTPMIEVPAGTETWTDFTGGPQHYYMVKSSNAYSLSSGSVIRSLGTGSAYVLAPDDQSYFEVTAPFVAPVEGTAGQPNTAYLVQASSRPQDLGGRIMKSMDFKARLGGVTPTTNLSFGGMGRLRLHYVSSGTTGFVGPSSASPTPDNMSVYWYNGDKWVQLYGRLDPVGQAMFLDSKYLGRYQLRTVERVGSFNFNQAGVSNRVVTPNGDGKNDDVVFVYDNPRGALVRVRILDRRGRVVAADLPQGPVTDSKVWAPAATVPGGVYIYQVESEGTTFSGTIVIVK